MPIPASPQVETPEARCHRLLAPLAAIAGVSVPGVTVLTSRIAQAGAGRTTVMATRPLVDLLDDAELQAALAHELAHIVLRTTDVPTTHREARQAERAADRLAIRWLGDAEPLCRALSRIAAHNAAREGLRIGGHGSDHPALRRRLRWIRHDARALGITAGRGRRPAAIVHALPGTA